jgi:hypothetical protein
MPGRDSQSCQQLDEPSSSSPNARRKKMSPSRILLIFTSMVVLGAGDQPARAAETEPDAIGKAWRARAALAAKKLAGPGLDACDRGVEAAFQHPSEKVSGNQRSFLLTIEVGDQAMMVSYSYEGQRLDSFAIVALPARWFALQKADSKTLTVLLGSGKCALDLCTNDPLIDGPCVEKRAR